MKKFFVLKLSLILYISTLAAPTLINFNIQPYSPPPLNGKIVVSYFNPTQANVIFGFSVPLLSTGVFESIDFKVRVVYIANGIEENLTQEYQFSSNNPPFNGSVGTFAYSLTIPAGKIGGQIKIKYFYKCNHSGGIFSPAQYSSLGFTTYSIPTEIPPSPFYKNISNGSIFIKIDTMYHLFYDETAINSSFLPAISTIAVTGNNDPSPLGNIIGGTITYDDWIFEVNRPPRLVTKTTSGNPLLVKDISTNKIYYVEKTGGPGLSYNARWIVNQETFDYYRFDASKITNQTIYWNAPGPPYSVSGWNLFPNLTKP